MTKKKIKAEYFEILSNLRVINITAGEPFIHLLKFTQYHYSWPQPLAVVS